MAQNACARFQSSNGIAAPHFEQTSVWEASGMQLLLNHARVADAVVKGPLLLIEPGHKVADSESKAAQIFRKVPAQGALIRSFSAVAIHHQQAARHLSSSRAKALDHPGFISSGNDQVEQSPYALQSEELHQIRLRTSYVRPIDPEEDHRNGKK